MKTRPADASSRVTCSVCPLGETHQHRGPLSRDRERAIRRAAREGHTLAWLCSHFGLPPRAIKRLAGKLLLKSSAPPSPLLYEATAVRG